jgi:hypothetical protein
MSHWCMGESATDCSTHDTQALDMLYNFWERRQQQRNVGQRSSSHYPRRLVRLGHQGVPHC